MPCASYGSEDLDANHMVYRKCSETLGYWEPEIFADCDHYCLEDAEMGMYNGAVPAFDWPKTVEGDFADVSCDIFGYTDTTNSVIRYCNDGEWEPTDTSRCSVSCESALDEDGVAWPETRAGTMAKLPCSEFGYGFDSHHVVRHCMYNHTVHGETESPFAVGSW